MVSMGKNDCKGRHMHYFWYQEIFYSLSLQFQPSLLINHAPVPAVNQNESFRYLGRYFDFAMSNQVHKNKLSSLFFELLKEIDSLPLHPKNKLLFYSRCFLSKGSWHF